jgi:hypothetical protein
MEDFLKRLKEERDELFEKTEKLNNFLSSNKTEFLSKGNLLLLETQSAIMIDYLNVLDIRIELLSK